MLGLWDRGTSDLPERLDPPVCLLWSDCAMSKGLGKVERLILDYLTGWSDVWEAPYLPSGECCLWTLARVVRFPREQWEGLHGPRPSQAQFKSTLRAVRSLERKGHVSTRRTRPRHAFGRGRPDHMIVSVVSADKLEVLPITPHLQE